MAGSRDRVRAALLFALGCCLFAAPRATLARSQGTSPFPKLIPSVASQEQPRYDTAYACEGKTLKIECKPGELIHLIRANYGRFSITICNDHGNTEWSVNCMSPKSLRVLHNRCSQQQNCSILASTSMFGDPCPGTLKYLEAHYQCMPATTTTTTTRPSLPWLITSQPSVWSTAKQTVTVRGGSGGGGGGGGATSHREPQPPPPPPAPQPPPQPPPAATPPPALGASTQKAAAAAAAAAAAPAPSTPPTKLTNITPPSTTAVVTTSVVTVSGEKSASDANESPAASTPEPAATSSGWRTSTPPATGLGVEDPLINGGDSLSPHSGPGDRWNEGSPAQPLQVCAPSLTRSIQWNWTRAGEVSVQPCPGGATGLARWRCNPTGQWHTRWPDLSECRSVWLTSLESRIEEGDSITSIANDLSLVTSSKTLYGGDMMTTTKIIKKIALRMASNIQTFPDPQQREAIVTELLQGVMRTGSNLLDAAQQASWLDLTYQEQMRVATSLLMGLEENAFLLADTVIREKTVVHKDKNILLSIRVLETQHVSSEQFPSSSLLEHWNVSRDRLELPRGALLENSDGGLVRLVLVAFDRLEHILQPAVPAIPYARNTTQIINSKVISASLGKGRHIQLSEPVRLWLAHLRIENVSNPMCVFWDYTMSSWSDDGCDVAATNLTHTHCVCNHLTNFAVLMDIHSMEPPREHQLALQLITYIGCSISVVCLVLAIITFQLFRGLKSDRTTIHKNLCVCLLIGEILFLAGIAQTDKKIVCSVVAGLLHFFFLCAFAWMFLEGFQLYVMLIEVFEAEKSRVRWYYLLAYGAPLLIVVISSLIDPSSYGTDRYCWLSADNFFIFSFVGPVIAVIIANLVFLSMAIYMMCRHANASASMKSKEHSRLASVRAWLRGAIVLVFLLGLTWTFGLLYLNQESIIMAYIFTILNSLQGLFIFVFHCVQNEKVRKEYRKFIRRHSWLPKWLRCWKQSGGKERRSSVYAGSNGNPSAGNSHSTESCGTSHLPPRAWNCRSSGRGSLSGQVAAPSPGSPPGSSQAASGGSAAPAAEVCVATLPYARNGRANNSPPLINLPKSATTWGPLHKPLMWKNISFKSYSRDSGHGGSEQEESPRTHNTTALNNLNNVRCLNNAKDPPRRLAYASHGGTVGGVGINVSAHSHGHGPVDYSQGIISNDLATDYPSGIIPAGNLSPIPQARPAKKCNTLAAATLGSSSGGHHVHRAASPYNHTYTEIREARGHHPIGHHGHDDDPVYEEIERTSEIQVSDMSDEDGKRQSDMSRQSSRSYGDHRPLISVSGEGSGSCSGAGGWDRDRYLPATSARTVAVLDGETVVCHLEPDQTHHAHTLYSPYHPSYLARTNNLPPYSEC